VAERDETPADEAERWASVPGFDGYEASDRGRVRGKTGRVMQPADTGNGYLYVHTRVDGCGRNLKVHRAVLLAFRGPPPPGCETRHLNGNRGDNRLENLQWGTRQENGADMRRHGRMKGDRNHQAKLTEEQVREILALDLPPSMLAARFGVSKQAIYYAQTGRRWAHLSSSPDSSALPPSTKDADPLTSFTAPVDAPCAPSNGEERAPSEDERRTA
jgi:hypothetical protein